MAYFGVAATFLGVMFAMFKYFESRMDKKFDRIDEKFGRMDEKFNRMESRIDRLESKLDAQIDRLDTEIKKLDARFDQKNDQILLQLIDLNRRLPSDSALIVPTHLPRQRAA